MICPQCKSEIGEGEAKAGPAGATESVSMDDQPSRSHDIRAEIRAILTNEYSPKDVVEWRVSQAVFARVTSWLQLIAVVAVVPVLAALVIFGITKWDDFSAKIDTGIRTVDHDVESAGKNVAEEEHKLSGVQGVIDQATDLEDNIDDVQDMVVSLASRATSVAPNSGPANPGSQAVGRLVYIQYLDNSSEDVTNDVRSILLEHSFVSPEIEKVDQSDRTSWSESGGDEVRYFRDDDRGVASLVALEANSILKKECANRPRTVVPRKPTPLKPPGTAPQLEIWLHSGCTPLAHPSK